MKNYLGYSPSDHLLPYAKFYQETMADTPGYVLEALKKSPLPIGSIPGPEEAGMMANPGYQDIETGYCLEKDGAVRVSVLTKMPHVLPVMWNWWFGWHGCSSDRYKLWHPKAHLSAKWKDGSVDTSYLNRISLIEEFIGGKLEKAAIRFVSPTTFGLQVASESTENQDVFICARISFSQFPLDIGYLLHQIRVTEGGSEMRSRFWLGGQYLQLQGNNLFCRILSDLIRYLKKPAPDQAAALLLHCWEEMNHLAGFLPELYREFSNR